MTELTPQQNQALDAIVAWYQADDYGTTRPFRLFGAAGCGKTTLARQVPDALGLDFGLDAAVQYGAYTGKAASVLRAKGCTPAGTLHSLAYRPIGTWETKAKLEEARAELAEHVAQFGADPGYAQEQAELEDEVAALEKESKTIGFEWNESSALADASLLILDEVSMVDAKLAADIERFQVPVLVLGDPEQLEPVGGEGYYINATPDFALTEIHRQALESPVLELATRVRTSDGIRLGLTEADTEPRSLARAMDHDQIICWKNATRWNLIEKIRAKHGRPAGAPVAGDRVMCLTNNRKLAIFNGQQFLVLAAEDGKLMLRDDEGRERIIESHPDGFQGRKQQDDAKAVNMGMRDEVGLFTFAQVITCHKAQGSEWGSVYVVDETPDLIAMTANRQGLAAGITAGRRWLYTAVSRASDVVSIGRAW